MGEIAGVAAVPLIVGLVEVAKRLGLPTRWAPALALVLGVAFALAETSVSGAAPWPVVVVNGLVVGLASVGLYSASRQSWREERRGHVG